jgi:hypothetical protein
MTAADCERHVANARDRETPFQSLTGPPVDAVWDPELAPTMTALNAAVQEESNAHCDARILLTQLMECFSGARCSSTADPGAAPGAGHAA